MGFGPQSIANKIVKRGALAEAAVYLTLAAGIGLFVLLGCVTAILEGGAIGTCIGASILSVLLGYLVIFCWRLRKVEVPVGTDISPRQIHVITIVGLLVAVPSIIFQKAFDGLSIVVGMFAVSGALFSVTYLLLLIFLRQRISASVVINAAGYVSLGIIVLARVIYW